MPSKYTKDKFNKLFQMKKLENNMRNIDVAQKMNCSSRTITYNCANGCWSYDFLRQLFKDLNYTDEEIIQVMRLGV